MQRKKIWFYICIALFIVFIITLTSLIVVSSEYKHYKELALDCPSYKVGYADEVCRGEIHPMCVGHWALTDEGCSWRCG